VTHRTTVRVRYPETDRMGVAYHGHYFVWFELGRTELMRHLGCDYRLLEEGDQLFFPVVDARARYLSPARYDDLLTVTTRMTLVTGVRVRFEYSIHGEAGVLATGYTEHAAVGADGRPRRMPTGVRERLSVRN
jgi:acyl-CoA thioester hydrolase